MPIHIARYTCRITKTLTTEPFEDVLQDSKFQDVVRALLNAPSISYVEKGDKLQARNFIFEARDQKEDIVMDMMELDEDTIRFRAVNTETPKLEICYEQFLLDLQQQTDYPLPALQGVSLYTTQYATITSGVRGLGFKPHELLTQTFRRDIVESQLVDVAIDTLGEGQAADADVHLFEMRFTVHVPVRKGTLRRLDFVIAAASYDAYESGELTVMSALPYRHHVQLLNEMACVKLS